MSKAANGGGQQSRQQEIARRIMPKVLGAASSVQYPPQRTSSARFTTSLQPLLEVIARAMKAPVVALLRSREIDHEALCSYPPDFSSQLKSDNSLLQQLCLTIRSMSDELLSVQLPGSIRKLETRDQGNRGEDDFTLMQIYQYDNEQFSLLISKPEINFRTTDSTEALPACRELLRQSIRAIIDDEQSQRRQRELELKSLIASRLDPASTFSEASANLYLILKQFLPIVALDVFQINESQSAVTVAFGASCQADGTDKFEAPSISPAYRDRYIIKSIKQNKTYIVRSKSRKGGGSDNAGKSMTIVLPLRCDSPSAAGVLRLQCESKKEFTLDDIRLLDNVSPNLGRFYHQQRRIRQLIEAQDILNLTRELTRVAASQADLENYLRQFCHYFKSLMPAVNAGFVIAGRASQKSGDSWQMLCHFNSLDKSEEQLFTSSSGENIAVDQSMVDAALGHEACSWRATNDTKPYLHRLIKSHWFHQSFSPAPDVNSILISPLSLMNGRLGLIGLLSSNPQAFDSRERELTVRLCRYVSLAIDHAAIWSSSTKSPIAPAPAAGDSPNFPMVLGLLNCLEDGIIIFNESQIVTYVNKQALDILSPLQNAATELVTGRPIVPWMQSRIKNSPLFVRSIETLIGSNKPVGPCHLETMGGSVRTIRVQLTPMGFRLGNESLYLAVIRDMSPVDEISNLKSEFMSVVSHEMRTPLTSIQGFSRLILDDLEIPREQMQEFMGIISSEADRLAEMIQRILDIKRMERGATEIHWESMDLALTLKSTLERFSHRAGEMERNFQVSINPPAPIIHGDPDKLIKMTEALLDNAFNFTIKNGSIQLDITIHNDDLVLKVMDNGCGIAPEDMPYIFDKFYRGRHSTTRRATGLGLGLTLAREIVERHHGTIDVESSLGQGATFCIRLPQSAESEGA